MEKINNLTLEELNEVRTKINTQIKQKENEECEQKKTSAIKKFYDLIGHNTQHLKIIQGRNVYYTNIRKIDCSVFLLNDKTFLTIKGISYIRTKNSWLSKNFILFEGKEISITMNLKGELLENTKIIPITQKEYENVKQIYKTTINLFK